MRQEKPTVESRSNSSVREKNPDEELMMDFVVLPEDLAQEGEEGMEGDTEIPFIPSWCRHPERVRQKNLKQKYLIYFFFCSSIRKKAC